ncbi:hypothetical protein N496_18665 (plasmid) [Clostridium botulinum A2B3 87]|uniref:Uncharacterized protein n=1 Tax=Clostridium botulinum TaxID=1491 RepID=A0A077K2T2_CLOBO|nr:hypothetical protein [Clostridium botulinum]KEI84151.1 hypothetical protein N493_19895 [Clostridium botulinum B2 433]KEI94995.1 hypothetical protein N496_18665 [Clostridium botulinum A2B3 87]BAP25639.1 hypothetical protein [Clostridium botulinum]
MKVCLIKRGKITHVGFEAKVMGEVNSYSICNKRWYIKDKVSIGETSEVTCKRCKKILSKIDKNGCVTLK